MKTVNFIAPPLTGEQLLQLYADIMGLSVDEAVLNVLQRAAALDKKKETKNA